jgi:hypothetical protein
MIETSRILSDSGRVSEIFERNADTTGDTLKNISVLQVGKLLSKEENHTWFSAVLWLATLELRRLI